MRSLTHQQSSINAHIDKCLLWNTNASLTKSNFIISLNMADLQFEVGIQIVLHRIFYTQTFNQNQCDNDSADTHVIAAFVTKDNN